MDDVKIFYRDVNLKKMYSENYKEKMLISERGFIDMTDRRGGPFSSHRYVIISNKYVCASALEKEEKWNMYTIGRNQKFLISDILKIENTTYYLLLHDNLIDLNNIEKYRSLAIKQIYEDAKSIPDKEVATISWLERCRFPLGMDIEGKLFE